MSDGMGWARRAEAGDRVSAPYKDGVIKDGKIVDVLDVMMFIKFDDGTETFCYKADRNLVRR